LRNVVHKSQRARFGKNIAEETLALEQGERAKIEILEPKNVEGLQGGGKPHRGGGHVGGSTELRPLLES